MKSENERYGKILKYLNDLGYGTEMIEYEVRSPTNRIVDLLVVSDQQNLIAIEVIPNFEFLGTMEDISYNPVVRQLQRNSNELKAKLFFISDGDNHLWFKSGDNGRPKVVNAVSANEIKTNKLTNSEFLFALMDHVSGFLENFPITGDLTYDMSIAIYSKICNDLNLPSEKVSNYLGTGINNSDDNDVIKQVIERWSNLNFYDNRKDVLKYIERLFSKSRADWQIPKWLADFLISFYPKGEEKEKCLDLFAKNGMLLSSAYSNGWKDVDAFYFNKQNEFWIQIHELLADKKIRSRFDPSLLSDNHFGDRGNVYDAVFVAPPFGVRLDNNQIKDSTELLVLKSLYHVKTSGFVIAIVPDSVLFSSKFGKLRKELKKFNISGIISLANNGLKPYSNLSTSILIIEKSRVNGKTFFATLDQAYSKNNKINLELIKSNWNKFANNEEIYPSTDGFVIDTLESDNLLFSTYWFKTIKSDIADIGQSYLVMPLKEITDSYHRGNSYKQSDNGDIPFVAPAAVRSLKLLEDGISFTTFDALPERPIRISKDDVLVNIIGTQRGSAALVSAEFHDMGINHHLIVLKPNLKFVRPLYLVLALNSDYVQKQFQAKSKGSVIPSLSLSIFDNLTLLIPPFYIQDRICDDYINLQRQILRKEEELNSEKAKLRTLLFDLGKEDASEGIS